MSLVELMVGLTIGMIGMLIISGVLQTFSAQKRTTVGSSDAQTIGGVATFVIERDLRRAGFGINGEPLLGCSLHLLDSGGGPSTLALDPVRVVAGTSDQLTIAYSTARHGWYYVGLQQSFAGSEADLSVDNVYGFNVGDLIVIGQRGVDSNADGIPDCTMRRVTAIDTANFRLSHTGGDYNRAGGEGVAYTRGALVYNFGVASAAELPEVATYAVNANNELTVSNRQSGFQPISIGENIIALRAWYCKDTTTPSDGTIDTCDQVAPTTPATWRQVIAIRFAVVARSPSREAGSVSDATLQLWPAMTLPNGTTLAAPTLSLSDEQRRYRYRVYGTLVPLRNMIWQVPNS